MFSLFHRGGAEALYKFCGVRRALGEDSVSWKWSCLEIFTSLSWFQANCPNTAVRCIEAASYSGLHLTMFHKRTAVALPVFIVFIAKPEKTSWRSFSQESFGGYQTRINAPRSHEARYQYLKATPSHLNEVCDSEIRCSFGGFVDGGTFRR